MKKVGIIETATDAAALKGMSDRLGNIQFHFIISSPDFANGLGFISIAEMA